MKRMVLMFHSLLVGPATFLLGLLIVLFVALIGTNRLVHVDTQGNPLIQQKCSINFHPITSEMIEVTRDLGWDQDPDNISRLKKLTEIHNQVDGYSKLNLITDPRPAVKLTRNEKVSRRDLPQIDPL